MSTDDRMDEVEKHVAAVREELAELRAPIDRGEKDNDRCYFAPNQLASKQLLSLPLAR